MNYRAARSWLWGICLLAVVTLAHAEEPAAHKNLLMASAPRQTQELATIPPVYWSHPQAVVREGTATVVHFAEGELLHVAYRGAETAWQGYRTLRIRLRCAESGPLRLALMEGDGGRPECWSLGRTLAAGEQELTFRLDLLPAGDLTSLAPHCDGTWNPDATFGVDLAFVEIPPGSELLALELHDYSNPHKETHAQTAAAR